MSYGFVQQDAGPSGSEHDRHDSGGSRARNQIRQRLIDCLLRVFSEKIVGEIGKIVPSAAAGNVPARACRPARQSR